VVATAARAAADLFEMAPTTPLLQWATAYVPSSREVRWLGAYHDSNPLGQVLKEMWYTTWAYPDARAGARYAYGKLFHEGHGPALERLRRLRRRAEWPREHGR